MSRQPVNEGIKREMQVIFNQCKNFVKGYERIHAMCANCHGRQVVRNHLLCTECEEDYGDTSK